MRSDDPNAAPTRQLSWRKRQLVAISRHSVARIAGNRLNLSDSFNEFFCICDHDDDRAGIRDIAPFAGGRIWARLAVSELETTCSAF
jgi:hypothetical protein